MGIVAPSVHLEAYPTSFLFALARALCVDTPTIVRFSAFSCNFFKVLSRMRGKSTVDIRRSLPLLHRIQHQKNDVTLGSGRPSRHTRSPFCTAWDHTA